MRRADRPMLLTALTALTAALTSSACVVGGTYARNARASYLAVDALQCPSAEISLHRTSAFQYDADGCGRSAQIVCDPHNHCEVVDDSPPRPVTATAAPKTESTAKVLRTVLPSIPYRDCGVGGYGKIDLTIEPDGLVERVQLVSGAFDPATRECVATRFSSIKVPAFSGKARTFRWAVHLPEASSSVDAAVGTEASATVEARDENDATTVTLRAILTSIPYRDCGVGGDGTVSLTVDATGATQKVHVEGSGFGAATKKCLEQRFGSVQAPPLGGQGGVIRWEISLPEAKANAGVDW